MKGLWFDANGFEIKRSDIFMPGTIQATVEQVCVELNMEVLIEATHWTLLGNSSKRLLIVEEDQEGTAC